jgi:hypothetical protein
MHEQKNPRKCGMGVQSLHEELASERQAAGTRALALAALACVQLCCLLPGPPGL